MIKVHKNPNQELKIISPKTSELLVWPSAHHHGLSVLHDIHPVSNWAGCKNDRFRLKIPCPQAGPYYHKADTQPWDQNHLQGCSDQPHSKDWDKPGTWIQMRI